MSYVPHAIPAWHRVLRWHSLFEIVRSEFAHRNSSTSTARTPTSSPSALVPAPNEDYSHIVVPLQTWALLKRVRRAVGVCVHRWREALGLRDRMVAEGIKLDGYSFNALIEACSKGGQVHGVVRRQADRQTDHVKRGGSRNSCAVYEKHLLVGLLLRWATHFFFVLFQVQKLRLSTSSLASSTPASGGG